MKGKKELGKKNKRGRKKRVVIERYGCPFFPQATCPIYLFNEVANI